MQKFNKSFLTFRYRVAQNKYLTVQGRNITFSGGIYCYFPPFPYAISINLNDEILIEEEGIILKISNIDTLKYFYKKFMAENKNEGYLINSSYFTINTSKGVNQNHYQKVISFLAEGYDEILKLQYKNFDNLSNKSQDSITALQPFIMIYHFHDEPPIRIEK